MQVAMKHALGQVNVKQLNTVALQMEKAGMLLRGKKNDETLWTTMDAVKIEREILAYAIKDQGKFEPAGFIVDLVTILTVLFGLALAVYLIYVEKSFG